MMARLNNVTTILHFKYSFFQFASYFCYSTICETQIFPRMDILRALRNPGVIISRIRLHLLIRTVRALAVKICFSEANFLTICQALGIFSLPKMPPSNNSSILIIDWNNPTGQTASTKIERFIRRRKMPTILCK